VHFRIYPVDTAKSVEASTPAYEITTSEDGKWGPFQAVSNQEYGFDLEYQGRHVRFYKAPIPRSTSLLNLRLMPIPRTEGSANPHQISQLLIARPQGYFSRERDPVQIDGKQSSDEPTGFPLRDSFVVKLPISSTTLTRITLRNETIAARPSRDLDKDLPIVDFLW
jgi:hypothetical protein